MKYDTNLFSQLESEGYTVGFWKDLYNDVNECDKEEAKELLISNYEAVPVLIAKVIKLPKVKTVTFDWLMNKIHAESHFINLAKHCANIVGNDGITVYPTSYGIGVFRLFGDVGARIKEIELALEAGDIEYTNEYSEAMYVYRFKISKAMDNIKRLEKLV